MTPMTREESLALIRDALVILPIEKHSKYWAAYHALAATLTPLGDKDREAVAVVCNAPAFGKGFYQWVRSDEILPIGTKLYTTPPAAAVESEVVVTTDESGRCVAVTRQDSEGRILSVLWEAPPTPSAGVSDEQVEAAAKALWEASAYHNAHETWLAIHPTTHQVFTGMARAALAAAEGVKS